MDRAACLIHASSALRRKIWASLPFSVRLADFFAKLAVTTTQAFGETLFAIFAKQGIEEVPNPKGPEARAWGVDVYRHLVTKFRNPQLVEEVMENFAVRFWGESDKLRPDSSLKDAKSYVLRAVTNETLNTLRRKHEVSDVYVDEGAEKRHELPIFDDAGGGESDDRAQHMFTKMLPRVRSKLEAIHPDVPLYLKLQLEGYTAREIVGDVAHGVKSMLTNPYTKRGEPMTERRWSAYKDAISKVFYHAFYHALV
jgi:DNA-directed RNA polymerase specialized sigma24 family protein